VTLTLTTPTAHLLGDPEPKSDEWFALRREGITATDMPKILGMSQYGNARSVWHDKRGELPHDESGEAALWGNLLEDVVAQEWSRRTGHTVERVGVLAHAEYPWMRASLDRLITGQPGALEIKTRSAFVAGKWRDEIPDDVLAQVAYQRAVTGLDWIEVACLIGGQRLATYRYYRDEQLEAYLVGAAAEVWQQVQDGTPPAVDMDGVLLDLLEQLYPDRSGEQEIDQDKAIDLRNRYARGLEMEKDAKRFRDAVKAEVVSELGEAEVLTHAGRTLFTFRQQTRDSINLTDLEDNDVELYAEVLAGGHITTSTSRVLRAARGE
jgi:putative phage-type endonuclease